MHAFCNNSTSQIDLKSIGSVRIWQMELLDSTEVNNVMAFIGMAYGMMMISSYNPISKDTHKS